MERTRTTRRPRSRGRAEDGSAAPRRRTAARAIGAAGAAMVLSAALLLASCSANQDAAPAAPTTTSTAGLGSAAADASRGGSPSSVPADATAAPGSAGAATGTTADFCAVFTSLQPAGKDESKGSPTTPEGWARRLDTVERAAAVAPPEIEPQADQYVQMIKDRTALAARFDYGQVPADAMQTFIAGHRDMQQQVNQLLGFVRQTCGGIGAAETGGAG